jgi:hypothetical protein
MKSSADLYNLIKSMTGPEKGYFRKYVSGFGTDADAEYLVLFEALDSLDSYDEKQLKINLAHTPFVKRLPVVKNYLYNQILKAMRSFSAGNSMERIISELFLDADYLWEKKLYSQALKCIYRIRSIAEETEEFALMLKALAWQKNAVVLSGDYSEELTSCFRDFEYYALLAKNANEYEYLTISLGRIINSVGENVSEETRLALLNLESHPLLQSSELALSIQAKLNFHYLKGKLAQMIHLDVHTAHLHNKNRLILLESSTTLLKEKADIYLTLLYGFILSCINAGNWDEYTIYIPKLQSIAHNQQKEYSANVVQKAQIRLLDIEVLTILEKRKLDTEINVAQFFKKYTQLQQYMNNEHKAIILSNLIIISFAYGYHSLCKKMIALHLQYPEEFRPDTHAVIRFIELMIAAMEKDFSYAEYRARSLKSFLTKRQLLGDVEKLMLNTILKIARTLLQKEKIKLIQKEWNIWLTLPDTIKNSAFARNIFYTEWLQSFLQEKTLLELIADNEIKAAQFLHSLPVIH